MNINFRDMPLFEFSRPARRGGLAEGKTKVEPGFIRLPFRHERAGDRIGDHREYERLIREAR